MIAVALKLYNKAEPAAKCAPWVIFLQTCPMFKVLLDFQSVGQVWKNQNFKIFSEFSMIFGLRSGFCDRGDISAQGWRKDPVESWLSMLFQLQTLGEHALYPENNIAMVSNALKHIHGIVKRVCRKDSRDFPKILQKP